jgi:hypothetical protein
VELVGKKEMIKRKYNKKARTREMNKVLDANIFQILIDD